MTLMTFRVVWGVAEGGWGEMQEGAVGRASIEIWGWGAGVGGGGPFWGEGGIPPPAPWL